jgi:hypothetical protein
MDPRYATELNGTCSMVWSATELYVMLGAEHREHRMKEATRLGGALGMAARVWPS